MAKPEYTDPAESAREECLRRFEAADPEGYKAFVAAEAKAAEKKPGKTAEAKAAEK